MARAKKSSKSKTSVKVNFKGVESRRTPPEGDYKLEVLEANLGQSQGGNDQIEFVLEISAGEYKGQKLWFYCPLQENSLWKLHAFLTALGVDVPEDETEVDLPELVGNEVIGVLTHETYQGKKRAKMTDFDSIDNWDGEDDEGDKKSKKSKKDDEDEPKGKKAGKGKKDKDDEPEAPDYDDMDEDELRDLYLEREIGTKKDAKKLDEDELKEALEEWDDEQAKKSKKGDKAGKSKKAKKVAKSDVEDMDEEELEELIKEHDLDVDLDDYKKLPKKIAAVIDELDEKDLLEDDDD